MIETEIIVRKLTASEGHVLTNGEAYGKEVYLGVNDNAGNWYEITDSQYAEALKKQEEELAFI